MTREREKQPVSLVACLNCHGKKYTGVLGGDGVHYPVACKGCAGTGMQEIRDS